MDYKVKTARSFEKELKRLGKRYVSIVDDYANLLEELYANPQLGTDLGGGLRPSPPRGGARAAVPVS